MNHITFIIDNVPVKPTVENADLFTAVCALANFRLAMAEDFDDSDEVGL